MDVAVASTQGGAPPSSSRRLLIYCTAITIFGPPLLYQLYEAQTSLTEPFADFAQAASKLYGQGAVFGQTPIAQRMAAGYDLLYRLGKDYEKPEFGIKTVKVDGHEVVIHESVEIEKPFCQLRRFKR